MAENFVQYLLRWILCSYNIEFGSMQDPSIRLDVRKKDLKKIFEKKSNYKKIKSIMEE